MTFALQCTDMDSYLMNMNHSLNGYSLSTGIPDLLVIVCLFETSMKYGNSSLKPLVL